MSDRRRPFATGAVFSAYAVFLFLFFTRLHFSTPYLYGTDPFYHIALSRIYSETGLRYDFPWTQVSVSRDYFSDKEILFHYLLIPCLTSGSFTGPKIYAAFLATSCFLVFLLILKAHDVRWPFLWLFLCLGSGSLFLYRMAVIRPQICGVAFALLSFFAATREKPILFLFVSAAYPLFYCAPHVSLGIAAIYAGITFLRHGRVPWKLILCCLSGLTVGTLLHPHFPHNVRLWYIQNVLVLVHRIAGTPGLNLADELGPLAPTEILFGAPVLVSTAVVVVFVAFERGVQLSPAALTAFVTAVVFSSLAVLSRRFVEYAVPFATLFLALSSLSLERPILDDRRLSHNFARPLLLLLCVVSLVLTFRATRMQIAATGAPGLRPAATWLEQHSAPGDIVFTSDWDEFPELFFYNTKNRYLVGLDPTFMYAFDKRKFELWHSLRSGTRKDLARSLRSEFSARYLLVTKQFPALLAVAIKDPRLKRVFSDSCCTVFEVPDV